MKKNDRFNMKLRNMPYRVHDLTCNNANSKILKNLKMNSVVKKYIKSILMKFLKVLMHAI